VKREADNAVTATGKNRIMIFGPKGDVTYVVEFRAGRGRLWFERIAQNDSGRRARADPPDAA
jgi:hypothetical protein